MIIAASARRWLIGLSALFLIPSAAIGLQDQAALESFHRRSLAAWPAGDRFLRNPMKYFSASKAFLADRVYPIIEATHFRNNVLFFVLHTLPQRRITLAADGFVFINGTNDGDLNNIFEGVCIQTQIPSNIAAFNTALQSIADVSRARGLPIDVILVPTLESLYGDRLPASVPLKYRSACGARAAGISKLLDIESPLPVHYLYPFAQMKRARDDPAFFPKGNWHPDGLSLKVVRDAYLRQLGNSATVHDDAVLTTGPAELLLTYGIVYPLPLYEIINPSVIDDDESNKKLNASVADLFQSSKVSTHSYSNPDAIDPETLLMFSDSFGDLAAGVFAGGFKRVFHVMTNDMRQHTMAEALARVAQIGQIDRVVFLFNENNLTRIIKASSDLHDDLSSTTPH